MVGLIPEAVIFEAPSFFILNLKIVGHKHIDKFIIIRQLPSSNCC